MDGKGRPQGLNTITPNSIVRNVAGAVVSCREVFGAEEVLRLHTPDGKVEHCELKNEMSA